METSGSYGPATRLTLHRSRIVQLEKRRAITRDTGPESSFFRPILFGLIVAVPPAPLTQHGPADLALGDIVYWTMTTTMSEAAKVNLNRNWLDSGDGVSFSSTLAGASRSSLLRTYKLSDALQRVGRTGQPAAILLVYSFLFDGSKTVAQKAAAVLQDLSGALAPADLPILDDLVRSSGYADYFGGAVGRELEEIREMHLKSEDPNLLGLLSCHRSGYLREQAVKRLDQAVHSGKEIHFLLLRLNDWAKPVRQAAEQAIDRRLSTELRGHYFEGFPLITRLRGRQRFDQSSMFGRIEHLLCSDAMTLLSTALANPNRETRRYGAALAWSTALQGGEEVQIEAVERTLASDDQSVRLRVAARLAGPGTAPGVARKYLSRFLHDPLPAMRRLAVGWFAAHESEDRATILRHALLDRSGIVRTLAQWHLVKADSFDLRTFYRQTIASGNPKTQRAAILGLGETGKPADVDLLLPLTASSEISMRKTAITALSRLSPSDHLEIFLTAFQDESTGLSRQAWLILTSHAPAIGSERLASIMSQARFHHVRVQTLSLIHRLSKWDQLPLLIKAMTRTDEALRQIAGNYLKSWLCNYNRTHQVQPSPAQIEHLRKILATSEASLPPGIRRELRALSESL